MGLPIEAIAVATNSNDILARTFATGRYAKGAVTATQSPAMDIQVASNFERLYFEAVGRDAAETKRAFETFAATGALDMPTQAFDGIRTLFSGVSVDEATTSVTMRSALEAFGEPVDPHTSVALSAPRPAIAAETPLVVLSTAHAAKFPEAVEAATGVTPALPAKAGDLFARPERFDRLPADVEAVKAYVRKFAAA